MSLLSLRRFILDYFTIYRESRRFASRAILLIVELSHPHVVQADFTELPTLTFRVQFDRLIIENNQEVWFPFIFSESKRTFLCNFLLFLRKIGELIQKVFY